MTLMMMMMMMMMMMNKTGNRPESDSKYAVTDKDQIGSNVAAQQRAYFTVRAAMLARY